MARCYYKSIVGMQCFVEQIKPSQIKAIGITNQSETTVIWDKKTGKIIHNALVCRRTTNILKS